MKNKKFIIRLLHIIVITVFLNSCAMHNGVLSSNAVFADKNFKVIGIGIGESQSIKILGFGGLKKNALVFEAKDDLYKKTCLKQGQILTNITLDYKHEFYIVFSKTKVTISGEIVDFNDEANDLKDNFYGLKERNGYILGEQIYIKTDSIYQLRKIERISLDEIQSISEKNEAYITNFEESFQIKGSFDYKKKTYSIGDNITMTSENTGEEKTVWFTGKVIGISINKTLLLDSTKNKYKVIKIDKK
ncbi:MAG: hypothetical protein JXR58_04900 [Bacteroidales bacterium]|nr:hypothetical protein [Bacteroidales bacterium]